MHQNIIVKNLTLAETIAHRNPEIANELLIKNGYPASQDRAELARKLNSFLLNQRDHALKQLVAIHPDRDLMFDNFSEELNADGEENPGRHLAKGKGKGLMKRHYRADGDDHMNCCGNADGDYSNCAGCGGACGMMKQRYMNASGDAAAKQAAAIPSLMNRETIAIVGLIALASIALIAVTKSKS